MISIGFFQVFLSNQVCNGDCAYCSLAKNEHRDFKLINLESFKSKLKIHLSKLENKLNTKDVVPIYWGGEPLLHPQFKDVVQIVESVCKELGLNIVKQSGTTNGTLFTEDWIRYFIKHKFKWMLSNDLTNDRTQVPLESEIIELAFSKGTIDTINTVVTNKTYHKLPEYREFIYRYKHKTNSKFKWRVCKVVAVNEYSKKNIVKFSGIYGLLNKITLKKIVFSFMNNYYKNTPDNEYLKVFNIEIMRVYQGIIRHVPIEPNDGLSACTARMFPAIDLTGELWHCTQDFLNDKNDDDIEGYPAKNYRISYNKCLYNPNCKWNNGICDGTTCEEGRAKYAKFNCKTRYKEYSLIEKYIRKWIKYHKIPGTSTYDAEIIKNKSSIIIFSKNGYIDMIYRGKYHSYDRDPLGTPVADNRYLFNTTCIKIEANDPAVDLYIRTRDDFHKLPTNYYLYRFDGDKLIEKVEVDEKFKFIKPLIKVK